MRVLKAELTKKNQLKCEYKQTEVGRDRNLDQPFNVKVGKVSDQEAHRDLCYAFSRLSPHILFSSELIDAKVAIPTSIEDKDWFDKFHYEDDSRFDGVNVNKIETFGKNAIEGVRLIGTKETSKGEIVPLKSPVIYFDRSNTEHYPLVAILESQIETLIFEIEEYQAGKNVNSNQLSLFEAGK